MRLYLVDLSGIAHWKWHSGDQTTEDGMLHGLRQWFYDFLNAYEPTHIVACLDGKNNWRKDPKRGGVVDYKANRQKLDPLLSAQLAKVPDVITEMGIKQIWHNDFEADDVIAHLCAKFADDETEVVIISSDKDLAQLIGDNVKQYDPRPGKDGNTRFYDVKLATEKHGVPPHRMSEYLALLGDSSDNVAGIKGWGAVNARKAINQTKSWLELVRKARANQLEKITPKLQQFLVEHLDDFNVAHRLVSLRFDVPLEVKLDDLRITDPMDVAI
jgi:DNA polymerase-1